MRSSLVLVAALLLALALVVSGDPNNPNTPTPDGMLVGIDGMCTLSGLNWLGGHGLTLTPPFAYNWFNYECTIEPEVLADLGPYIALPTTSDPGSTAEVTLNGVQVNFRTMNQPIGMGISNMGDGPGPDGNSPYSPLKQSSPLQFQDGWNNIMIGVGCNGHSTPPCYYQYNIKCWKKCDPGTVGDPQFVGLRGQQYQIHGVSGEIYNIVSDSDLQYNSRFVFLDRGDCPVVDGKKQKNCFSHPGSYLGELGLKTRAGDKIHVKTGSAKDGFAGVEVNGRALQVGDSVLLAGDLGSVSLNSTHVASVHIGNWGFEFENSDMYLNQRVHVADKRGLRSHGLLGQTWRETTYPGALKHIQGVVDDYVIRESDIFGDDFVFNAFN